MSAAKSLVVQQRLDEEPNVIARILAGQRELYYDLIAPYERMVYVCALSVVNNEAEAEDCAQEAFLKAYQKLDEFKGESRFSSWLVRIALNEAKLRLRKSRVDLYESLDDSGDKENGDYVPLSLGDWRDIPSEALERKEVRAVLKNAVKSLPDIYREVFVLRDVQQFNVAATAQILGVREGVVKTRLLRARLQLRELLAPLVKSSRLFSRQAFRKGQNPWL